jgi:hypothetical protein
MARWSGFRALHAKRRAECAMPQVRRIDKGVARRNLSYGCARGEGGAFPGGSHELVLALRRSLTALRIVSSQSGDFEQKLPGLHPQRTTEASLLPRARLPSKRRQNKAPELRKEPSRSRGPRRLSVQLCEKANRIEADAVCYRQLSLRSSTGLAIKRGTPVHGKELAR